tara:strand:- start:778 stop:1803 length:1026 start_codon:yes stop_codon:yes gene_type:complete
MSILSKRVLLIILSLFFILLIVIPTLFYHSALSFNESDTLRIKKGASLNEVVGDLETDLDFDSGFKLKVMMKLLFVEDDIKPGRHSLGEVNSIKDLIRELRTYPKNEVKITLLEGWSLKDIANYLENNLELIKADNFIALCNNQKFINKELIHKLGFYNVKNLEGYIYPETYYVDAYLSEKELIKIFISEFLNKTKSINKDINNEVMIIASIIEAETDLISEMDTISSVYNNRINRSMRLESDPTILFYMSDPDLRTFKNSKPGTRAFGKVWKKYKNMDNPYNTYKYLMPPGPINSPRIEAIYAALNPANTNYIYMVMNGRLRRHLFADDLIGHNKNRKKK